MSDFLEEWPIPECQVEVVGNTPEDIAMRAHQNYFELSKSLTITVTKLDLPQLPQAIPTKKTATLPKKKIIFSLKPRRHVRAVEIYSHCYYPTHVKPIVKAAIRKTLTRLSRGQKLTLINTITHQTFDTELDTIKEEIFTVAEQLREEQAEAAQHGDWSPEDYPDAIDTVPMLLNRFLQDLAMQTGWWFSVISGGPDPADNGNICTGSFHIGQNKHDCSFEDEYTHFSVDPKDKDVGCTSFDEGVIAPFGRFLKTLFPLEIQAQRACNKADLRALETTKDNKQISSPTAHEAAPVLPSPGPAPTPTPSTPAPSFIDPMTPSTPVPLSINPTTEPVPINPLLATMTPLDDFNPDLFEDASFGHAYFGMTSMEADHGDYNSLLGCPSSSKEAVSFPFGRIDHRHVEMDIDPLFHGLEMAPFQEPHVPQLPCLPDPLVDLSQLPQCPHNTEDLEVTDKIIMQWNSPELEDRSKDGIEVRTSKRTRKPPASCGVIAVGWLPSAITYLTDLELSEEWQDLLIAWQALEMRMSLSQGGAPGKGRMGAIASWPAVLMVWLSNRRYNVYLGIPATFSTDLLAWWNTLQPGWRHSDTGPLPLKDYSGVLDKALRKGGPNGIITMLIGLMWWGQGTLSMEEAALWKAMVADVRACIHALTPSSSV
ncbi:hypothetical protein EDD18DRAFT_1462239 [Armillaria luteobubalina]|uniref:Uncharacterized protein n=1 Tax=Armillaria luteobubalina TaxID=153913 RepID=A0AA39UXS9_9AGAR|nr:hypothetical protein EDD18DRAFT_1462239 [Armillaria luteobubalina]